jgi:hypothetical protein
MTPTIKLRPVAITCEADWNRVAYEYPILSFHRNHFGDFVCVQDGADRIAKILVSDALNYAEIRRAFCEVAA